MRRLAKTLGVISAAAGWAATVPPGVTALATANGGLRAQGRTAARARSARTITLNENARLHLTSRHGFTLNERGTVSGTVTGTIYVHLTIVSTSRVTAEVNIYPSGGSITGQASASYHRGSSTASFAGTLSIARGTGDYANAHGSGLSFSGTIQRSNEAIAVSVRGQART